MSSNVIKEFTGTIEELCIYPEYEFWTPLAAPITNPLIDTKLLPDKTFETSPAFKYRSWVELHDYTSNLIVFRLVILAPPHLEIPVRLIAEAVLPLVTYNTMIAPLEVFTLRTLGDITV